MRGRFPIAAYARTLSKREQDAFAALPLLKHDPMRAIRLFERRRRRAW